MAYQAMFTETGRITAIPTSLGEHPPAEQQSDLFTWSDTEARREAWNKKEESCQETADSKSPATT